ncbi:MULTISPECIES: PepSY-associated TM helix domain-containing protein [Paenibacillus]|uniref:PepSY-associated TM helix domain-containing protein n=1 Tax=Paenibacillus TaxID=44249 RepID=UPI0022B8C3B3|nr:PepSY domain-containing protein [Paenibacillus caseinilyticus]MCZ8518309.1 PepSY domain-containing protein [Paenibacillus caseinilyticus]
MAHATPSSPGSGEKLYRTLWRWHFYAGIIFAPLLILLAVTGAIYLFKAEYEEAVYHSYYHVVSSANPLPAARQLEMIQSQYPSATISKFKPAQQVSRSSEFTISTPDGTKIVFLNPYTGDVLGELDENSKLMNIVKKLHSGTIAGPAGNWMIELAACWAVILIVTGLYLWWPRGQRRSVFGTLLPRLSQGRRIFWRDLHAVPAFWLSGAVLILVFTGLPWSAVWGEGLNRIAAATNTGSPPALYGAKPKSTVPTRDIAPEVPWAAELMPVTESVKASASPRLPLDQVMQIANEQNVRDPYVITFPKGETGIYVVTAVPVRPENQVTLHIDQYNGKILSNLRFADYGATAKVISVGVALHEGRYFGLTNQIVGLIACIGMAGIAFSGVLMWWRRRPAGKLGAPSRTPNAKLMKGTAALVIAFGLFLPLAGVSILIFLLLDRLVIRFLPTYSHSA